MLSLVIDIQSDVVEGSLIKFAPKGIVGVPHVLYSASLHIPRKPHTGGDYLAKMMIQTTEELAQGISKELHRLSDEKIQVVHYVLSSPWVLSKTKIVEIVYDKDTSISDALIQSVMEKERSELKHEGEEDMVFVEQKIFDVKLNGYSVEKYQGKQAQKLQIAFAFTLSSDQIIKKIQQAVASHLHSKKEFFHSAILLQYITSRTTHLEGEEYMVFHVHGEHTDIVVVKKGLNSYLASFPFGTSTITRKVSHVLKETLESTTSTLKMYVDLRLNEEEQKKIETLLMPICKDWQSECTQIFKELGEGVVLPRKIHLFSLESFAPLLKKSLEEIDFEVVIHYEPLREVHSFALKDVL